jgi:hypothetical protein
MKTKVITLFLFTFFLCSVSFIVNANKSINDSSIHTASFNQNEQDNLVEIDLLKDKNTQNVTSTFFWSLLINIVTLVLIIAFVYYPNNKQMENIFSFFMFNLMIFLLTFLLNKIKISMGAAFGLFAVFSMLRYRTEGISMKDMTYLFIFISVGLISAIHLRYFELIIINGIVLLFIYILDGNKFFNREQSKLVDYENIEMIKAENYDLLIKDLKNRTGLEIHRIIIEKIDFLKDAALIKIFYYEK